MRSTGQPRSGKEILRLIGRVYELGMEAEHWPTMLDELAAIFGCTKAAYAHFDSEDVSRSLNFFRHPEPDSPAVVNAVNVYSAMPPNSDVWFTSFKRGRRFGQPVIIGHTLVTEEELLRSDVYNQVGRPVGMFDILTIPISHAGGAWGFCNLFSDGPDHLFSKADAALFGVLRPHILRVVDLQRRFGHMLRLGALNSVVLDKLNVAVLLVAQSGRISFTNKAAQSLLSLRTAMFDRNGQIATLDSSAHSRLLQLISQACGANGDSVSAPRGGGLAIVRPPPQSPLSVQVLPFEPRECSDPLWRFSPERLALIIVSDPGKGPPSHKEVLRAVFGFTPVELNVADLMMKGMSQNEIAEALHISGNTMRWHVKNLLAKTDTHREAQLVLKLARTVPPVVEEDVAS